MTRRALKPLSHGFSLALCCLTLPTSLVGQAEPPAREFADEGSVRRGALGLAAEHPRASADVPSLLIRQDPWSLPARRSAPFQIPPAELRSPATTGDEPGGVWNGAVIGGAIGLVAGFTIGVALENIVNDGDTKIGEGALIGAGAGVLVGASLGALIGWLATHESD